MHAASLAKRSTWIAALFSLMAVFGCDSGLGQLLLPLVCPNGGVTAGVIEDPNDLDPNQLCDPNTVCDPNLICIPCDPNQVCDPNLICTPCDPNDVCDPNLICPVEEPTIAGVWETVYANTEGAWDDPNASLALMFEMMGNPFEAMGEQGEDVVSFMIIDEENRVVFFVDYESTTNTLQVEQTGEGPAPSDMTLEAQDDGTFMKQDFVMIDQEDNGIQFTVTLSLIAYPAEEDGHWYMDQSFTVDIMATQDGPQGTEIYEGDQAVYRLDVALELSPSVWPTVRYPDATWEIIESEGGGE